jgi:hypothetical protein
MDPGVIGVFIPILGIVGGFGILGLKLWSQHQLKMREPLDGENERLTEAVQQLQEEIAEIHERLDFTERMLSEVREQRVIERGDSP